MATTDSAVRVIHVSTGRTETSEAFDSQIENKAMALVRLLRRLR